MLEKDSGKDFPGLVLLKFWLSQNTNTVVLWLSLLEHPPNTGVTFALDWSAFALAGCLPAVGRCCFGALCLQNHIGEACIYFIQEML